MAMLTVDEARSRVIALAPALRAEPTPLVEASGLTLAHNVVATRDLPGFDNSAMDGYAVRGADITGASRENPKRLRVDGEVAAGAIFEGVLAPGAAIRIMTGAPIPAGADSVLEVEETESADGFVECFRGVELGRSLRRAGSDIARGELALQAGTHLGPAQLALLAALGVAEPECVARPRVALLATGNELVDVEVEPGPGQVVDVVGPALGAAIRDAGAELFLSARARDSVPELERALKDALRADVIISVGGVSMGEYDLVRGVLEAHGNLDFWKVAMRPGKPLAVGMIEGKLFIGLPGNPVSALVCFEVFVLPVLLAMSGHIGWRRPIINAVLAEPLSTPAGLRTFARATLELRENDRPLAHVLSGQGSYQLRSLAQADALLDIPEETTELPAGATVTALVLTASPAPPFLDLT